VLLLRSIFKVSALQNGGLHMRIRLLLLLRRRRQPSHKQLWGTVLWGVMIHRRELGVCGGTGSEKKLQIRLETFIFGFFCVDDSCSLKAIKKVEMCSGFLGP
jgi:hypothetical protein